MKLAIDAIYENGIFRPIRLDPVDIAEGQRVRITVDDSAQPEALRLATNVYEGLPPGDIDEIERIALDRGSFFGGRTAD